MDVHIYSEEGKHFNISEINKYELTVERSTNEHLADVSSKEHIKCFIRGELKKIMQRDNHSNYNTCILDLPEEQARILAHNILNVIDSKSDSAARTLIDETNAVKVI